MNKEDIIRMYAKANGWSPAAFTDTLEELERFAALVASAEREACAALCFQMWEKWMDADPSERGNLPRDAEDCAHAIRSRGQA